ncbi:MAG: bifunctional glutamate N-acetyltransferase/amino-acid acetyltransferase ArgJ [Panacagrimonas sp.]
MAVNLQAPQSLLPVKGVRLAATASGIKQRQQPDLALMVCAPGTQVAGVFTRNAFCAPPVQLCRERLAGDEGIRAFLINAGNANAATGQGGRADAEALCAEVAAQLGCDPQQVLPFSTGVIGQRLPVSGMQAAVPALHAALDANRWLDAAQAIMTTDTLPKGASRKVKLSQAEVTVTGIAKGVGMICPDMATLLAFVATDAPLSATATDAALRSAVGESFNCVTVDGDTSTNDACMLMATGAAGGAVIEPGSEDYNLLLQAVTQVCVELAQAVVRDGEGASKFITLKVTGARHEADARQVAQAIAHSPLVKTAMFASDANWGRLVMAIGKSGVENLQQENVSVWMDAVCLIDHGQPHADYREALGAAVVARPEFGIRVDLGMGSAACRLWTCDLGYDYVRINAEYRT